ncbi:phage tail collar domain-containing protein [Fadolivirus algeromassiliense]|jgi:microcystin-dependent protein|uniref:Phage tail collar domain-containing protein n=1 Tax=Fadolivirus FV1/VV64 TaxID=3070911 RepID=A0A7D3V7S9_9VIRU|nr:phage tail collar domain-containing protein [Fadolivirus algeromassiliense]QKF94376.1 phage tail collar domain-containing protein [Fadolivirus FV1/VV64]
MENKQLYFLGLIVIISIVCIFFLLYFKSDKKEHLEATDNILSTLDFVKTKLIVKNMIIMWSGADNAIPQGWALCNGQNGTPDLRDRFIVGSGGKYPSGSQGGNEQVTLSVNQLPSHNHPYCDIAVAESANAGAMKSDKLKGLRQSGSESGMPGIDGSDTDNNFFCIPRNTDMSGGNQAVDIRPKYYSLAFIMRL